ncbi:class E sortase [Streptomyces purpurogeneiscleroticus]|uniref:class E sortase n=1 Tax=Streptomyces purpurogeneiscleroticus TaxID=68259 RepID=UPI001CC0188F|nr:class E sortase [Streptomyces purpurogeneiscleroticus]
MRQRIPVVVRLVWTAAELAVTLGAVLVLLVVHQLWWTNQEAQADARQRVSRLEREWRAPAPRPAPSEAPSATPEPGPAEEAPRSAPDPAYAVLRIPRLGVTAPVAEGVGKAGVLDKGYVGHYPRTAQPGRAGNFALAGHRNTHGEPFRRLDRLRPGDTVRIDTAEARYTYLVERTLPQTTPGDGTVLARIPYSSVHPGHRFTEPGYYLTLTTCTPEYTSTYRLVVWGRLAKAEPR